MRATAAPQTIPELRELAKDPRVVAIGECGLDFNRNYSPHPDQEKWFVAQIELALISGEALVPSLPGCASALSRRYSNSTRSEKAVAHCFTGEREELRAYLDLGLYVGITGWICDERRGRHLVELVREIPRDRLLLETDAPYLTPRDMQPQPKARRNEPAFLPHIARAVARALGRPVEEVAAETTRNARSAFRPAMNLVAPPAAAPRCGSPSRPALARRQEAGADLRRSGVPRCNGLPRV